MSKLVMEVFVANQNGALSYPLLLRMHICQFLMFQMNYNASRLLQMFASLTESVSLEETSHGS